MAAAPMAPPGTAKAAEARPEARTTETGATEAGATQAGATEAAEKSTTRHLCRFLSVWSIKFLDTTGTGDVNQLDDGHHLSLLACWDACPSGLCVGRGGDLAAGTYPVGNARRLGTCLLASSACTI
jgi:hypothetical protein